MWAVLCLSPRLGSWQDRRMRFGTWALALTIVGAGAGPAGAQSPAKSFLPAKAVAVAVWQNPRQTLRRVEAVMAQSGFAAPAQSPGWLEAQLVSRDPRLQAVDMTQPVYVAVVPHDTEPAGVMAVVHRKESKVELKTEPAEPFRLVAKKKVLLLLEDKLDAAYEKPTKKPYRFGKTARQFWGDNDLFAHMSSKKVLALLAAFEKQNPERKEDLASFRQTLSETRSLAFAAQLADEGLFGRFLGIYDPDSPTGKAVASTENTDDPLIYGLPAAPYFMMLGSRGGSAEATELSTRAAVDQLLQTIEDTPASTEMSALMNHLKKIDQVYDGLFVDDQRSAFGFAMPADWKKLHMVGWIRGSAQKTGKLLSNLAQWMQGLLKTALEQSGSEKEVELREVDSEKVGKVKLEGYALQLGEGSTAELSPEAKTLVQTPLRWGEVDDETLVFAWNAPSPSLTALAERTKNDPLAGPKFARTQKQLARARVAEMYLDVGPVAAGIMADQNPMMARSMTALLSTLPAFGGTLARMGEGLRMDMFVPIETVQVAGGLAALFQQ